MLEVLELTPADTSAIPWKNGRGTTRELAVWPEAACFERGDFDWRISLACVDAPGPFSSFAGYDRVLVVTRGNGLVISHGASAPRARLRPLEPYRFSGDWPTNAVLVSGAVTDLNVIFRRGRIEAELEILRLGVRRSRESLCAGHAVLHVIQGRLVARVTGEEEPYELGAEASLWVRGLRGEEELSLAGREPETEVCLIEIRAAV